MSKIEKTIQTAVMGALPVFAFFSPDINTTSVDTNSAPYIQEQSQNSDDNLLTDNEKRVLEAGIAILIAGHLSMNGAQRSVSMEVGKDREKKFSKRGFYAYAAGLTLIAGTAIELIENNL